MQYRVTSQAREDLREIHFYWAQRASLEVADRLIDTITERFWLLGEFPEAGRHSSDIAAGVRCFPAGTYLIYYAARGSRNRRRIDILHIFHGARDQERALRSR
jgi:toxin ParE1/3/4